MTIATCLVNADGSVIQSTWLNGFGSHWQCVRTNDGNTSWVGSSFDGAKTDTYRIDTSSIPASSIINSITVHVVARKSGDFGPWSLSWGYRSHGTNYFGGSITPAVSWQDYAGGGVATDANTGLAFALSDLTDGTVQLGYTIYSQYYTTDITQIYVDVDYTEVVPSAIAVQFGFGYSIYEDPSNITWTDVTDDVMSLDTKRGRMHVLDRIEAGTATVKLNNAEGNYWRNNTGGSYYPYVKPLTPMRITTYYNGLSYPIFYGYTEAFKAEWVEHAGGYAPVMVVSIVDFFKTFTRYYLIAPTTGDPLFDNENAGDRFVDVIEHTGLPLARCNVYPTTSFYLSNLRKDNIIEALTPPSGGITVMQHLEDIATAEQGQIYVTASGSVNCQLFAYRQDLTVQATFNSSDMPYVTPELVDDDTFIYNEARIIPGTTSGVAGIEQVYDAPPAVLDEQGERSLVRRTILYRNSEAYQQAYVEVNRYKESEFRCNSLTIYPDADPDNLYPIVFGYDISTVVKLKLNNANNPANLSEPYHIEQIEHHWKAGGVWETKWQLWDTNEYRLLLAYSDGWMGANSAVSYATAQSAVETTITVNYKSIATPGLNNDTRELAVGQSLVGAWNVFRSGLRFPVNGVPAGAPVQGAKLLLHTIPQDFTPTKDIIVHIMAPNGVFTGPLSTLASTDYFLAGTSLIDWGSVTVTSNGAIYNNTPIEIEFNAAGVQAIIDNPLGTGNFDFVLRSEDDTGAVAPLTEFEYIVFQGNDRTLVDLAGVHLPSTQPPVLALFQEDHL